MGVSSPGLNVRWMSTLTLAFVWTLLLAVANADYKERRKVLCYHSLTGNRSIYDYEIGDLHSHRPVDWSRYRGNVVLVVNVASF